MTEEVTDLMIAPRAVGAHAEAPAREPDATAVQELEDLCDHSRFMTAHRALARFGPVETWTSADALSAATRVVRNLGGAKLAKKLALRNYRINPRAAEARYWFAGEWVDTRGPLAALEWLADYEPPNDAAPQSRAFLHWLRASIYIAFRDFDEAERWIVLGDELSPDTRYSPVMWVSWLASQDRYADALDRARDAVERHPDYRPSVQSLAGLLELHGDWKSALDVLERASKSLESGLLHLDAAVVQLELRRHADATLSIERGEALLPMLDDDAKKRLLSLRSDAAYGTGDVSLALELAKQIQSPFHESLVKELESKKEGRRALLDVGFVRQHHLTCVPATLATLSRFWNRPVEQLQIADKICYNGTRAHSERLWAEQNGWLTREFTVTWDSARALLDRGVPFIMDTVHAVSAHAQAVTGYDERRGTLYIRDPFVPATLEAGAQAFLESYRAHGPRGLALVPHEHRSLLDGIELGDSGLYDVVDRLEGALKEHDREAAIAAAKELEERAPGHRLTILAARALGSYDSNPFAIERANERALELYPNEPTFLLSLFAVLRDTATSEKRMARLEEICGREDAHPVFREMLASDLQHDSRRLPEASRMLRRVARSLPDRGTTVGFIAHGAWQRLEFERALSLYRIAACLDPTDEHWADSYFRAAMVLGRADEAVSFLRRRVERFQRRSSSPSITLFLALESLERTDDGFEVLASAIAARPEDGDLRRFAAEAHGRYGELETAKRHLDAAEKHSGRTYFLRTAAALAEYSGNHTESLEMWMEVASTEPLSVDAHAAVARRLAALRGAGKAREYLCEASTRFPNNAALLERYVAWLSGEDPSLGEKELRRLIALQPSNAWAHRELALDLGRLGRHEEALDACGTALKVAPHQATGHLVLARLHELRGRFEEAKRAFWAAFELQADSESAISALADASKDNDEARATLLAIEERLTRASVSGEGVLAWYRNASRHLPAAMVEERLEALHAKRSDLWTVWSCRNLHHRKTGKLEQATAIAREATERFPLLPAVWLDLARSLRLEKDMPGAIAAVRRAIAISPAFSDAILLLAETLEFEGALDHGLSALERGLHHNPSDVRLLLTLADTLWQLRRRSEALAAVQRAIEVDPTDGDAWSRLRTWAESTEGAVDALGMVEKLVARRPWDPQMLLRLAEAQAATNLHLALETIERAVQLDPSSLEAHDTRARVAADLGHRALALTACRPKELGTHVPVALRGREAWLKGAFGDVKGAIASMREVVRERPDYGWGWRQIADFAEQIGDKEAGLEAAEAVVRLEPTNAVSHGYLGQALLDAGKRDQALVSFRHALELDPTYRYAAHHYLSLLFEDRAFDKAKAALEHFGPHLGPADVAYWTLRFAVVDQNGDVAENAARSLFSDPDASGPLLKAGRKSLTELGWRRVARILDEIVVDREAPAHVGALWAEHALSIQRVPGTSSLRRLRRARPEVRCAALAATFDHLGARKRVPRTLWITLTNWTFVRTEPRLWGTIGFVLTNGGRTLLTVLWHWNYERHRPKPWMLLNVALALRDLGFVRAASRASRAALTLPPDQTAPRHLTLLALDAVMDNRALEAQMLLDEVGKRTPEGYFTNLHELVSSLAALSNASLDRATRDEHLMTAWQRLHGFMPRRLYGFWSLERIQWRRVARRLGRSSKSAGGFIKGYWDSLLLAVSVPVAVMYAATAPQTMLSLVIAILAVRFWLRAWGRRS